MQDTMEFIEAYFQQVLKEDERRAFEQKCETDNAFAKEVAFYIATHQVAHEALLNEKQTSWQKKEAPVMQIADNINKPKRLALYRWVPYAAAACIIFIIAAYFLFAPATPQQLASTYIKTNFSILSQKMDGSRDSMQLGMASYNNQQYTVALPLFEGVAANHPDITDAKKYAGLSYLWLKEYDKALEKFKDLADTKGLYSNSGDFLQAITLLERNNTGDKEKAKVLLQKVVNENEDGSDQANEWLSKLH